MDLRIEKETETFTLRGLGLNVLDIEETSAGLDVSYRTLTNRSGRIRSGSRYSAKKIVVTGDFYSKNILEFDRLRDNLYGRLLDRQAFYITKLYPKKDDGLYQYEDPGQTTGEYDHETSDPNQYTAAAYRYRVVASGEPKFHFRGRSEKGLLYQFAFNFETDGLPFGETPPKTLRVTNQIDYKGTTPNSQLESPWYVKLTSNAEQPGDFYFTVQGRRFEHQSLTPIKAGDVFELRGVETRLNDSNINKYTNYEHFVLLPGRNTVQTNFKGTIDVINYKELYV